jgi:hypothetical protein
MTRCWLIGISLTMMTLVVGFATADDKPKEFPTEQHKQLDTFAGTWDVAITFKFGGQERQGKATIGSCATNASSARWSRLTLHE